MPTPTSSKIRERATELYVQDFEAATGETPATPELHELRESGYISKAKRQLMGEAEGGQPTRSSTQRPTQAENAEEIRGLLGEERLERRAAQTSPAPSLAQGPSRLSLARTALGMLGESLSSRVMSQATQWQEKRRERREIFLRGFRAEQRKMIRERGAQAARAAARPTVQRRPGPFTMWDLNVERASQRKPVRRQQVRSLPSPDDDGWPVPEGSFNLGLPVGGRDQFEGLSWEMDTGLGEVTSPKATRQRPQAAPIWRELRGPLLDLGSLSKPKSKRKGLPFPF